eukprot:6435071-Prymnesium_polylepis.1
MPPCHCGVHSHNSKPFSRNRLPREVTSRFVGFVYHVRPAQHDARGGGSEGGELHTAPMAT